MSTLQPADKRRLAAAGKGQGVNLDIQKIAVGGPLGRPRQGLVQGEGVAVRVIASHLEMCERTVRYSIRRLEQAGKVKVLENKSKPNRYRILQ